MVDTTDNTQTLTRIVAGTLEEPKPATNKNHIRVYNHNQCPFAARGRYALSAKAVEFQECLICTHDKATWFKEANGGMVPLMELPTGDLIPESAVIAQFAIEKNDGKGIDLVPKDPVLAAKMRLKMDAAQKLLNTIWGVPKGEEGIKTFKETTRPGFEKLCQEAGDKWLLGTDDITQLDIWVGPFFEMLYMIDTYETDKDIVQLAHRMKWPKKELSIFEGAPAWKAYVEKFREHPAIKPLCFNPKIFAAQVTYSEGFEAKEETSKLALASLKGQYPEF